MNQEELNNNLAMGMASGQMSQASAGMNQANMYLQEQEKGLVESQLEVESILEEIYHMLKQDVYKEDTEQQGKFSWQPLEDQSKRALTDWGVDRIMQVMKSYINKNTLLSNFDEKIIARRMLKFMLAMNGLLLMKYEFLFRQPTFEECKQILKERMDNRKKVQMFSLDLMKKDYDEKEIEKRILFEMEDKIEKEVEKIRQEKRKQNLREYELLLTQLEAMVESTHNRAWRGEERGSIRRHTNIHEIHGQNTGQKEQKTGGLFSWRRS